MKKSPVFTYQITDWLPTTLEEVKRRGWDQLDVILFSGDAYVDHPSFGHAVIGRIIEQAGYKIAIVPQPNWRDDLRDFKKLGKPRLFFGVTAGCMDSMVNHYTANKRLRSNDAYTPDGKAGFRPDYATMVYSKILKEIYPEIPVIIGGVEASLRRVTHYDYWSDQLKPTILEESKADLLVYGMGEQALKEILHKVDQGLDVNDLKEIPQTAFLIDQHEELPESEISTIEISSHQECLKDKKAYASNFKIIETESNKVKARRIIQGVGKKVLVVNPPFPVMTEQEIDASFDLPYTRLPHPKYKKRGPIPAYEMIRHSINMHRGCFGGCSFCTISAHQGKFVASRSEKSILKEVDAVTQMPDFKGYISDLGGPSANMYKMKGIHQGICDSCLRASCIFPKICSNLDTNHKPMTDIYRKAADHPSVKKAFVGSGIRYDMLVDRPAAETEKNGYNEYISHLVKNNVSGRLKVAPEHTSEPVLKQMRKPSFSHFYTFKKLFDRANQKAGLNQQLIPYFISSHPASTNQEMAELAAETKQLGFRLEQVQDFTPTPMTLATVIYYSGIDPYTMKEVYTARTKDEKLNQRKFFFWYKRENWNWIRNALSKMNRLDLADKLLSNKK